MAGRAGNQCGRAWPRGRITRAGCLGVAHRASPSAHLAGADPMPEAHTNSSPMDAARKGAVVALALVAAFAGALAIHPAQAGARVRAHAAQSKDQVRALQQALGVPADGVFGPGPRRPSSATSALTGSPPTASSARKPVRRWGSAPVRCSSAARSPPQSRRQGRQARSHRSGGVRGLCSTRSASPPTASSAPDRGGRQALPGRPRPDRRTASSGPQTRSALGLPPGTALKRQGSAAPRRRPRRRLTGAVWRVIAAGNRIAEQALQVRRRPRHLPRLRLRLLGLGLLRPARRRAARLAARLDRLHELRPARAGPPHHDLRERGPRLHGRGRPALRHQRPARDRLALDAKHRSSAGYVVRHPRGL